MTDHTRQCVSEGCSGTRYGHEPVCLACILEDSKTALTPVVATSSARPSSLKGGSLRP